MNNVIEKLIGMLSSDLSLKGEHEEKRNWFLTLDNEKFISIYYALKNRQGISSTIIYLDALMKETNFIINESLLTVLREDEELVKTINSISGKKGNRFVNSLSPIAIDECGEFYSLLYTPEEEREAFKKYISLKNELYDYIINKYEKQDPIFIDFINYNNKLLEMRNTGKGSRIKLSFETYFKEYSINALYSYTCDREEINNIKNDEKVSNLVNELKEIRDDIFNHNMKLVIKEAKKYLYRGIPEADLRQAGYKSLITAIDKFKLEENTKFSTYAVQWIISGFDSILEKEGSMIRIPISLNARCTEVNKLIKKISNEKSKDESMVTKEEIYEKAVSEGIKLTKEQIDIAYDASLIKNTSSIDKSIGEDDDNSVIDFVASDIYEAPEEEASFNMLREQLETRLNIYAKTGFNISKRKEYKDRVSYHKIILTTSMEDNIVLIVSSRELKKLRENITKYGEVMLIEFLNKYGIDSNDIVNSKIEEYEIGKYAKRVMIYRLKKGFYDDQVREFIKKRNYNNALCGEITDNEELTFDRIKQLFDVTGENVRTLFLKTELAIQKSLGQTIYDRNTKKCHLYMDQKLNVYDLFGINKNKRDNYHKPIVFDTSILDLEEDGIIMPIKAGLAEVGIREKNTEKLIKLKINISPNKIYETKSEKKLILES